MDKHYEGVEIHFTHQCEWVVHFFSRFIVLVYWKRFDPYNKPQKNQKNIVNLHEPG